MKTVIAICLVVAIASMSYGAVIDWTVKQDPPQLGTRPSITVHFTKNDKSDYFFVVFPLREGLDQDDLSDLEAKEIKHREALNALVKSGTFTVGVVTPIEKAVVPAKAVVPVTPSKAKSR